MSRDPKARFKHVGLPRIPSEARCGLILPQCASRPFVHHPPGANTESVASSDQFQEGTPGQEVPLSEWEIHYGRATAKRIPAL
jgi:hypothetical protein